jgi:hypothetical protein
MYVRPEVDRTGSGTVCTGASGIVDFKVIGARVGAALSCPSSALIAPFEIHPT